MADKIKLAEFCDDDADYIAKRKPKNTSATRWRMELARRADPIRFALAGVAIF